MLLPSLKEQASKQYRIHPVLGGSAMSQIANKPPRTPWAKQHPSLVLYGGLFLSLVVWAAFTFGIYFAFIAASGSQATTPVAHAAPRTQHVQVNLNIIIN